MPQVAGQQSATFDKWGGLLAQTDDLKNVASVPEAVRCSDSVCSCNRAATDETAFWEEVNSALIRLVCIIERHKLHATYTTSELRKAGKQALCKHGGI